MDWNNTSILTQNTHHRSRQVLESIHTQTTANTFNRSIEIPQTYPNIISTAWGSIFKLSFITTRETSLQSFQYRIIHRTITCRKKLHDQQPA